MTKKVIITGAAGQDGLILGTKLAQLGFEIFALVRNEEQKRFLAKYNPDLEILKLDSSNLNEIEKVLRDFKPGYIYHLSSKSSVADSWSNSEDTITTNVLHTLNWLNALNNLKMHDLHFFHASSSEMYGLPIMSPQNETTSLHPRSPYGVSKAAAHHLVINYRESFGQFASTGILFNHESPLRPERFVTRKITKAVAAISLGKMTDFSLGNLEVSRDWGWAPDYVDGMLSISNYSEPEDFVIATGNSHTLIEFLDIAFAYVGISDWEKYVSVDSKLSRPAEVQNLVGDSAKARKLLNWKPTRDFESIVQEMVNFDIQLAEANSNDLEWKSAK